MLTIKQRQMNLKFLGLYSGDVDGIAGTLTRQAYKDFQSRYGLEVDGIYGKNTNAKLIEIIKEIQSCLGIEQDGVAGPITKQAQNELILKTNKTNAESLTWDSIKHFSKDEFTCKCGCGLNNIELEVVKIADEIREYFGSPAIVSSGTRCKKHNEEVGGLTNSRHLKGKAIDMYIECISGDTLENKLQEYVKTGKLRYSYLIGGNSCHFDIQ